MYQAIEATSKSGVGRRLHDEIYSASWPDTPKRPT
jgi:hypothetical protein